MTNFFDKKRGFGGGVSPESNRVSNIARRLQDLGYRGLEKFVSKDDKGTTISKSFGMYERQQYFPVEEKVKDDKKRINAIEINFGNAVFKPELIAALDGVLDILLTMIEHADYMRETFCPAMIAYYNNYIGKFKLGAGMYVELWREEDIAPARDWWANWANSGGEDGGYNAYVSKVLGTYNLVNTLRSYIVMYYYYHWEDVIRIIVVNTQHFLPEHDVTEESLTALNGSTIWFDSARIPAVSELKYPSGSTEYLKNSLKESAVHILYDKINDGKTGSTYAGSPEQTLSVNWNWGAIKVLSASFIYKTAIDKSTNNLYIITTDPSFSVFSEADSMKIRTDLYIEEGGKKSTILQVPNDVDYFSSSGPNNLRLNEKKYIKMGVKCMGRMPGKAVNFGMEIIPDIPYKLWYGGVEFDALDYKGLTPYGAMKDNWFLRTFYSQTGGYDPYADLAFFSNFAAVYYDHPIVTGVDIYPLKTLSPLEISKLEAGELAALTATELAELVEVNTFVNTTYTFRKETQGRDVIRIMTNLFPYGDCEDFSVTKIDQLLKRGWSVSRLKLAKGCNAGIETPIGLMGRVGHAWVVATDSSGGIHVLDNSSNSLLTEAEMWTQWPEEIARQISGMSWSTIVGDVVLEKFTTYEFDDVFFEIPATLTPRWQDLSKAP